MPFDIYQEQLTSLYHGIALWRPNPVQGVYNLNKVSIGDVGYISEGSFIRILNVTLPWDSWSNRRFFAPSHYESLSLGDFDIRCETFGKVDYYSHRVSKEGNTSNWQAASPDEAEGVTYRCRGRGALLSLPHGGHREDAIHTKAKVFEKYIRGHAVSWFNKSKGVNLPVERMDDLILVTGCTMVNSWAAAVFNNDTLNSQISLASRTLNSGGASFIWNNNQGTVEYHDSQLNPNNPFAPQNQCVFIKGFRAKRILFWTRPLRAAAEPLPEGRDGSQEEEMQVTRVPDTPKYRDPLIAVLDYIVKKCLEDDIDTDEDDMAITHHDDLQLIKGVEVLSADAVEQFLQENELPLLVADGTMMLRHPLWQVDEHEVFDRRANSGASGTTVNRRSNALGSLSRPPAPMQMSWGLLPPLSHTRNLGDTGDPLTANHDVDVSGFLPYPPTQPLHPPPYTNLTERPNRGDTGDQLIANLSIEASEVLSCPPVQMQNIPLPRVDTERPRDTTRDQSTVRPNIDESDVSSRSREKRQMSLGLPRRRSDTKRPHRGDTGDNQTWWRYALSKVSKNSRESPKRPSAKFESS